ncbi:hypothetical protein PISL3812_06631 [Talaromyces islandicus]|uniref:Cytochrome b-c1 complex subunit 8 n=1 Tax=Talaromyces islandicus TaxID=28573 RepID=A0A0U1M1Y4_TALIS|nr:hypothetical protein PISL3812_06631 [Talaromyces islandicus]
MVAFANPKAGHWAGPFGSPGTPIPQKYIAFYALSPNRQRIWAGAAGAAVFNTFRRFRHQVFYVAPPFMIAYGSMNWAIERYSSSQLNVFERKWASDMALETSTSTQSLAEKRRGVQTRATE